MIPLMSDHAPWGVRSAQHATRRDAVPLARQLHKSCRGETSRPSHLTAPLVAWLFRISTGPRRSHPASSWPAGRARTLVVDSSQSVSGRSTGSLLSRAGKSVTVVPTCIDGIRPESCRN